MSNGCILLREDDFESGILYPARLSFQYKDRGNTFLDMNGLKVYLWGTLS